MKLPDPVFPPLLNGSSVAAPKQPFAEACRKAQAGELGAADLLWATNTEVADCAIVLEPDVSLAQSQQLVPVTMLAMAESLAALCPPKVAVQFRWPRDILINGAKGGDVRFAAEKCAAGDVPRWIVIGMRLQLIHSAKDFEPGERLDVTCLAEEGVETLSRSDVLQSLSAHWMARLHDWQYDGFAALHDQWLFRAEGSDEIVTIQHEGETIAGKTMGLDDEAGLLLKDDDAPLRVLSHAPYVLYLPDLLHLPAALQSSGDGGPA